MCPIPSSFDLFPVRARATRALFSVQLLARVLVSGVCLVISFGSEFLYLINSCERNFVQFRCKRQVRGSFLRHVLMAEEQIPHPIVVLPPDVPVPEELPVAPPDAAPVVVPAAAPAVENPANAADAVPQEVILRQFNSSFTPKISLIRFLASLVFPSWLFLVGFLVGRGRRPSMLSLHVFIDGWGR